MYSFKERIIHFKTGFTGKPDESAVNNYGFQLSEQYLSYSLPSNNNYHQTIPKISALNENYFKKNSSTFFQEEYIEISSNEFFFGKVIKNFFALYNSVGHLFFVVSLRHCKKVDCTNLSELSNEIYSKHFKYYNEFDESNPSKGDHKRKMQEAEEYAYMYWTPYDGRELTKQEKQEKHNFLNRSYYTSNPPLKIKIKTIGENEFITYSEGDLKYLSKVKKFYCLPINEDFYLCFEFRYGVEKGNWNKKFKNWIKNTTNFEETIIKTIELSNIVNSDLEQLNDNRQNNT